MSTDYVTLVTSLPYLGDLFDMRVPPISRLQLDKRLSMLNADDQALLLMIENLLQWDHLDDVLGESGQDELLIKAADELLLRLTSDPALNTVLDVVRNRLDMRSIVAALRYRARGVDVDIVDGRGRWSYGHFDDHIRRHWEHPTFALDFRFSWVKSVHDAMSKNNVYDVEKTLLSVSWKSITLAQQEHTFDFVAVILYVLKWNIAMRWQSYEHDRAFERFTQLVDDSFCGKYTLIAKGL